MPDPRPRVTASPTPTASDAARVCCVVLALNNAVPLLVLTLQEFIAPVAVFLVMLSITNALGAESKRVISVLGVGLGIEMIHKGTAEDPAGPGGPGRPRRRDDGRPISTAFWFRT